jgi:hypothetical protein
MQKTSKYLLVAILATSLTACGGGGGSDVAATSSPSTLGSVPSSSGEASTPVSSTTPTSTTPSTVSTTVPTGTSTTPQSPSTPTVTNTTPAPTTPSPTTPSATAIAAVDQGTGVRRLNNDMVNGIAVTTYQWTDSSGRQRSVSLKKQGSGNAGNGGYAVQMTYVKADGSTVTAKADDQAGDGGFGYFVAHEKGRQFDDGSNTTIAAKNNEDDSPLSRGFPLQAASPSMILGSSTFAVHEFLVLYPKWGTKVPMADVDAVAPAATSAHVKYMLPVTIRWVFEAGKDMPRIDIKVDMRAVTPGQLAFDVRGPYGVINFANSSAAAVLNNVQWGDSGNQFSTLNDNQGCLSQGTDWRWDLPLSRRPYHALTSRDGMNGLYEIGLIQQKIGADTLLTFANYTDSRNRFGGDLADYNGNGAAGRLLPWDWPFQSANYSIPPGAACATGFKFAWGSAAYYGSLTGVVSLGPNVAGSAVITAMPANKSLVYRTCLVLGLSPLAQAGTDTLTRQAANSQLPLSCSSEMALQ